MIKANCVDQNEASTLLDAALKAARDTGKGFSIAVCDRGGFPVALLRMDGAGLLTAGVAQDKARTAALLRAPSSVLGDRVKDNPALLRLDEYLPMPGGLPVMAEGECIGAIGVSGGSDDEDVAIATAALAALD